MVNFDEVEAIWAKAKLLHSEEIIHKAINKIAAEMNEKLADKKPLFLCVMNGSLIFTGQLLPKLNFPLQLDYIHVSRYQGEIEGRDLHWMAEPTSGLEDRTIVIMEDILDSGLTLAAVKDYCLQHYAKEVFTAAMIDKDCPRVKGGLDKADFTGLHVENKFLIGYGLDFRGYFRNLPGIYAVEE